MPALIERALDVALRLEALRDRNKALLGWTVARRQKLLRHVGRSTRLPWAELRWYSLQEVEDWLLARRRPSNLAERAQGVVLRSSRGRSWRLHGRNSGCSRISWPTKGAWSRATRSNDEFWRARPRWPRARRCASTSAVYSRAHRDLNVSRIGFVADLLARHGVIAIVAAVSPFAAARAEVRGRSTRFVEVHVDCPLAECERRDVKGMYALARAGRLGEFTGISSPYEPPAAPELRVDTARLTIAESAERVLAKLYEAGMLELP